MGVAGNTEIGSPFLLWTKRFSSWFLVVHRRSCCPRGSSRIALTRLRRAGAEAFYWISITLSMTAFLWISLDALGLLPANTTSSWWFRILIYRLWLVIGTAVSCATSLILNSSLTPRIAVASNATPRPIRNLMMPLEGALLPVLRFRRSGSVYATRQNLLGAAPSQDTG